MIKRLRSHPKAKSKSKSMTSAPVRRRLFGQPQVLEGEDRAAYDKLHALICTAVKPVDIIEEMFIVDLVALEWEVLRWRRLKSSLIRAHGLGALDTFLVERIDFGLYSEQFVNALAGLLQDNAREDQADSMQKLAHEYAQNNPDAADKVTKIFAKRGLSMDDLHNLMRRNKANNLMREYAQRKRDTVRLVNGLLAAAGESLDSLMADALAEKLDDIERIERLTTIAEKRRNAMLAEIERRRALLGATLRQNVQEIEDTEFKVIETTPAKGKNAA